MEYYGHNDWRDYHLAHYGRKGMKKGKHLPGTEWWKNLKWGKSKPAEAYKTDNEHDVMKLRNTAQYWKTEAERSKSELNKHRGTMGSGNDPQSRTLANQYGDQKDLANRANSELNRANRENAEARKRKADKEKEEEYQYVFGIPLKKRKDRPAFSLRPYNEVVEAPKYKPKSKKLKKSKTTRKRKRINSNGVHDTI